MLLIGQHDSPFVRRVGIALDLYGLSYQHEPYSVFRDAEKIAAYNPLRRVPTLVLDDGVALSETFVAWMCSTSAWPPRLRTNACFCRARAWSGAKA
jgi:hypothetical protein